VSTPELDLDAEADETTSGRDWFGGGGGVLALAIGLAGLVGGLLVGSAVSFGRPARSPLMVTLSTRDLYLDTAAHETNNRPVDVAGTGSAPAGRLPSDPAAGRPVVILRLQVANLGTSRLRLTSLILTGVASGRVVLPLSHQVPSRTSVIVDVAVRADCPVRTTPALPQARLTFNSGPAGGTLVQTTGVLRTPGGLCSLVDVDLPTGWQRPLIALSATPHGADLDVTLDDLSQQQVAGAVVDGRLLPTLFVGDQLLPASAQVKPGTPTLLRLRGPPPCVQTDRGDPAPSTVRILADGREGIEQRLVVIGPELTRWLRTSCDGVRAG
jgi:hypothetical protein